MSRQVSPSTDQVYGLQRVTRIWGVSRATIYRHRHPGADSAPKSPGRWARCRTRTWWRRNPAALQAARSTAKGTASSGHGCASQASAPAGAGSCG